MIPQLEASLRGFVNFFPYAADIAFFRPHVTEVRNFSYIPAIVENLLIILIVGVSFIYGKTAFVWNIFFSFCLFFTLSYLLLAGYTITFSGSIVRYKSIVLPYFVTPFFLKIHFERITKKILKK
jgi:hypothetical protein